MRAQTAMSLLAIATLAFAIAAVPSANAAPPNDACALVTQAQMSAALGVSVAAGTHATPTFVQTCTWNPSKGATKVVRYATVSIQDASGYARSKMVAQQMQAAMNKKGSGINVATNSASGIGDDAYYTSMGTGYTGLLLKKGNVALKIAIYGEMPVDKKIAAE